MNNYFVKMEDLTGGGYLWWIYKIDGKTLSYKNGFRTAEDALMFIETHQPGSHVEVIR